MEMVKINSGKLRAIGYDARDRVLQVQLDDGTTLQYSGVAEEVWRRLRLAFYGFLGLSAGFLGLNATTALSQQALESSTNAAQKPTMEADAQCIKANDQAYRLYSISQLMIEARQNKASTEHTLASDPKSMAQYKSYEKALADGMTLYRQMGGTAKTLDDIKPVENPCPSPVAKSPSAKLGSQAAAAANMQPTISKKMRKSHNKLAAHSKESKRSRNSDARECAKLESNQAIMACAEKFR